MGIEKRIIEDFKSHIEDGGEIEQKVFMTFVFSMFLGLETQVDEMRKEVQDTNVKLEAIVDEVIDDIEEVKEIRKRYPSITWLLGNKLKTTVPILIGFVLAVIYAKDYLWLLVKSWLGLP